jgi:chaperone modulatory protein CbpM
VKLELTEAVWLDERGAMTLVELAESSGLSETELRDLVDLGALEPLNPDATDWNFGTKCIVAARTAFRLRNDFELDTHGLAVVLSLLERVQELEAELQRLQARLPRMHRT